MPKYKQMQVEEETHALIASLAERTSKITGLRISRGALIKLAAHNYAKVIEKQEKKNARA